MNRFVLGAALNKFTSDLNKWKQKTFPRDSCTHIEINERSTTIIVIAELQVSQESTFRIFNIAQFKKNYKHWIFYSINKKKAALKDPI